MSSFLHHHDSLVMAGVWVEEAAGAGPSGRKGMYLGNGRVSCSHTSDQIWGLAIGAAVGGGLTVT